MQYYALFAKVGFNDPSRIAPGRHLVRTFLQEIRAESEKGRCERLFSRAGIEYFVEATKRAQFDHISMGKGLLLTKIDGLYDTACFPAERTEVAILAREVYGASVLDESTDLLVRSIERVLDFSSPAEVMKQISIINAKRMKSRIPLVQFSVLPFVRK